MNTLVEHVNKLIRDNPDKTQQARKNPSLAGWFVGQVMKDTDGDYPEDAIRVLLARRGIAGPRS
jgi:aspartyl-tRNA(Asn)/glutamyl-tRNA(Gln) amidotransferase subunit B